MRKLIDKARRRTKLKRKIRANIRGTSERPRVSVYRSNRHIYAQVIDDTKGVTIASSASGQKEFKEMIGNKSCAKKCGEVIGKQLKRLKIKQVVFDRNGFVYHGVIRELADAIREQGIVF